MINVPPRPSMPSRHPYDRIHVSAETRIGRAPRRARQVVTAMTEQPRPTTRSHDPSCPTPVARCGAGDVEIVVALRSERQGRGGPGRLSCLACIVRVLANAGLVRCVDANQWRAWSRCTLAACWGCCVRNDGVLAGTRSRQRYRAHTYATTPACGAVNRYIHWTAVRNVNVR